MFYPLQFGYLFLNKWILYNSGGCPGGKEEHRRANYGHNLVSWGDAEDSIATCYFWYYLDTGRLVEFDIVFEDDYVWSSTGEVGKYDVQNIATHEFGHTLSLGDLYGSGDTEKTMYGYASPGETKKRTLHKDDIDGICYIYPKLGAVVLEIDPSSLDFGEVGKSLTKTMTFRAYNVGGGTSVPYAKIQIFTLAGELVKTLEEKYGSSKVSWDGRNERADKVARGIYIYIAKHSTGKIAVVK